MKKLLLISKCNGAVDPYNDYHYDEVSILKQSVCTRHC